MRSKFFMLDIILTQDCILIILVLLFYMVWQINVIVYFFLFFILILLYITVVLAYGLTHWSVVARNLVVQNTTLNIKRKSLFTLSWHDDNLISNKLKNPIKIWKLFFSRWYYFIHIWGDKSFFSFFGNRITNKKMNKKVPGKIRSRWNFL